MSSCINSFLASLRRGALLALRARHQARARRTGDGKGRNLEVVLLTALDGLAVEIRSSGACRSLSGAKG